MRATYVLIDLSAKPKWFLGLNPAGSSPTLQFDDRVIADSYDIVRYLEETYPHPTLDLPGNEEAERVTGDVFSGVQRSAVCVLVAHEMLVWLYMQDDLV